MLRLLLALPLLPLTSALSAQTLPQDADGRVVYRGHEALPGQTQAQLLTRAVHYARFHFVPRDTQSATWLVDSSTCTVSGLGIYDAAGCSFPCWPLQLDVTLQVQPGGYTYDIRNIRVGHVGPYSPPGPSLGLQWKTYYEPVEKPLDQSALYYQQHPSGQGLRQYCAAVADELKEVLTQLRTEMAKP